MNAKELVSGELMLDLLGIRAPNTLHAYSIIGSKSTMDLELYVVTIYSFTFKKKKKTEKRKTVKKDRDCHFSAYMKQIILYLK